MHKLIANYCNCFDFSRHAKGAAAGQNLEAAIGWLSAAKDGGVENISEFIQDPIFDPFREEPSFTKFQG